jgi:hypothetical protein
MDIDFFALRVLALTTIAQNQIEQNTEDEYVNNIELFRGTFFKNFVFEICMALNRPLPNIKSTPSNTTPERITHFLAHSIEYEYVENLCSILLDIVDRLTYCIQCQLDVNNQSILSELQQTENNLRQGLYMFRMLWLQLSLELRHKIYHMLADDYGFDLKQ